MLEVVQLPSRGLLKPNLLLIELLRWAPSCGLEVVLHILLVKVGRSPGQLWGEGAFLKLRDMTGQVHSLFLFGELPPLDLAIFVQTDESFLAKFFRAHFQGRLRLIDALFRLIEAVTDLASLRLYVSHTKQGPPGFIGDVCFGKVLHALPLGALGICV